jgi:hypothetical protein
VSKTKWSVATVRDTKRGDIPRVFSIHNRLIRTKSFLTGASRLVLGLGELGAFAVNLGRLSLARFDGMALVGSQGC